jgi:hypothetical protein
LISCSQAPERFGRRRENVMSSRTRAAAGLAATVAAALAVAVVAPAAGASGGWADRSGYAAATSAVATRAVASTECGKPEHDAALAAAAKRFGLSEQRLERALVDVKT